jgi:hypothetical protein
MVFAEDRDSNVFEQINTDSTLTRVAVDSNWNVWVVNSSGKALRYNGDGSWTQLDLGVGSANRKAVDVDTGT